MVVGWRHFQQINEARHLLIIVAMRPNPPVRDWTSGTVYLTTLHYPCPLSKNAYTTNNKEHNTSLTKPRIWTQKNLQHSASS